MTRIKTVTASALVLGLVFAAGGAQAHCDSVDGPVAAAAQQALDSANVHLALPYAPASAEAEIRASFGQSLKVRGLGPEARSLADRAFIETTVRLHRAGEGAPFTGLKPAGIDHGPAIPAAEQALATGDVGPVKALLDEELEHGLHARFPHAAPHGLAAAKTAQEVPAARERVSAELGFVTYVEGLRQAMHGAGHEHKE